MCSLCCCSLSTAGDYFGELALLPGGNTRAATVRARTDVSLLVLDRANFESLLGPLMPQLQASAKSYTGYTAKHGIQVRARVWGWRRRCAMAPIPATVGCYHSSAAPAGPAGQFCCKPVGVKIRQTKQSCVA